MDLVLALLGQCKTILVLGHTLLGDMALPQALTARAGYGLALLYFVLGSKLASSRPLVYRPVGILTSVLLECSSSCGYSPPFWCQFMAHCGQ